MRKSSLSILFLFTVIFSNSVLADYYWMIAYPGINGTKFPSATEACDAYFAASGNPRGGSSGMASGGASYECGARYSVINADRGGDGCNAGKTYDDKTGACNAPLQDDGQVCDDQTGTNTPDDPMIFSKSAGKCVRFTESDDNATCAYLGSRSSGTLSYSVAGNWDGGTPSAPPTFTQDGLSCEVATVSTTECVTDIRGAVQCNVIGKLTGKVTNKSNTTDAKEAACPGDKCDKVEPAVKTTNDPCVYSGSGDSVSCTSDSNTSKDGTQNCGTVNGAMTCLTVQPSSNGIKIASTVKTTTDADGGKTAVKTDTATKTTCTGVNKCTTSTSTTTTTTKSNSSGQTTSTKTDCKGTCGTSGTGIGSATPSGNGTGDQPSGECTSEDCGTGGAGVLTDPQNGNFDGQSSDWDKKIEDGKKDLKDRIDKMKTAFDPLSQANLGGGGGQLFCPPAVEFYGHSITFCLDQFASSLSWVAAAVYASCALTALFIIFL